MGAVDMRVGVVRAEVHVGARDALDALDICVDNRAAKEVEIQIVLFAFVSTSVSSSHRSPAMCISRSAHLVIA